MATYFDKILPGAQGLLGLKAQKMEMEDYEKQKADMSDASNSLRDYYKTGNQESLINATMKSPQLAQQVLTAAGIDNKQKQERAAQDVAELWQLSDNPDAFKQRALKRVESIMQSGGNPSDTISLLQTYDKDPQQAKQLLRSIGAGLEATGYRTGIFGDQADGATPSSIKELEYYEKLKARNPEAAEKFAKAKGYVDTPKEENRTEAQRNMAEYQRLQKESPELAKQFGQSVGLVSKEGKELSAQAQKRLSEFTDSAIQNGNLEQKYLTLANDFEKANVSGGIQTSWSQWAKEQTGNQDEVTELRKEFFKIRGSEVVNNLPPGAASDADIAMALSGFPGDKASGEQIASFLRGLAKLKAKEKELNEFKANYISENGTERGMLQEWKSQQANADTGGNVIDWGSLQ